MGLVKEDGHVQSILEVTCASCRHLVYMATRFHHTSGVFVEDYMTPGLEVYLFLHTCGREHDVIAGFVPRQRQLIHVFLQAPGLLSHIHSAP